MLNKTYQPKGSMCAICYYRAYYCRHLDFARMQPMSKPDKDGAVVVKCTRFVEVTTHERM